MISRLKFMNKVLTISRMVDSKILFKYKTFGLWNLNLDFTLNACYMSILTNGVMISIQLFSI